MNDLQIYIDQLLDDRNIVLWDKLNKEFSIDIQESSNLEYRCFTQGNKATIYIAPHNICKDSFTHELLHVYLISEKIFIGAGLQLTVQGSNVLKRIFSNRLLEHFGNCLDHIKTYGIYINMGFDPEKFIADYSTYKFTSSELNDLKMYYKQKRVYRIEAVDFYIGKFVAMSADFNKSFNYESCFNELEKLDPALFSILDRFIGRWGDYDILNKDIVYGSYYLLLNDFYEGLKGWITNKTFA